MGQREGQEERDDRPGDGAGPEGQCNVATGERLGCNATQAARSIHDEWAVNVEV